MIQIRRLQRGGSGSTELPRGGLIVATTLLVFKEIVDFIYLPLLVVFFNPVTLAGLSVAAVVGSALSFFGFEEIGQGLAGYPIALSTSLLALPLTLSIIILSFYLVLFGVNPPKKGKVGLIVVLPIIFIIESIPILSTFPLWSIYLTCVVFSYKK